MNKLMNYEILGKTSKMSKNFGKPFIKNELKRDKIFDDNIEIEKPLIPSLKKLNYLKNHIKILSKMRILSKITN